MSIKSLYPCFLVLNRVLR